MKLLWHIFHQKKGFTLLEILIISAIFLVVSVILVLVFQYANKEKRDVFRVSQMKQLQSALENYYVVNNEFPEGQSLSLGKLKDCDSTDGPQKCSVISSGGGISDQSGASGKIFMSNLNSDPNGSVECGNPSLEPCVWSYTRLNPNHYFISMWLEKDTGLLQSGNNCVTERGIFSQSAPCS